MSDIALSNPTITVTEFAALHKIHPRTVRRLIHEGKIPAVQLGRQMRIPAGAAQSPVATSAAALVARTCSAQNLPEQVEDPGVLQAVASILGRSS